MILTLFGFIMIVALVMITIGLAKPSESAQALIGFSFLFILAIIIIGGNVQYKVGDEINSTYNYDSQNRVSGSTQITQERYENFNDDTSHQIGYYLAIASSVGFAGVLYSLRRTKNYGE